MCMFTHLRWFSSLQVCLKITIHMGLKKSMTVCGLFLVSWTYLLLQLSQGICRLQQQSLHRSSSTIFLCQILDLNYWQDFHIYIIITPAKLMWAIIHIFSNSEHTNVWHFPFASFVVHAIPEKLKQVLILVANISLAWREVFLEITDSRVACLVVWGVMNFWLVMLKRCSGRGLNFVIGCSSNMHI